MDVLLTYKSILYAVYYYLLLIYTTYVYYLLYYLLYYLRYYILCTSTLTSSWNIEYCNIEFTS